MKRVKFESINELVDDFYTLAPQYRTKENLKAFLRKYLKEIKK